VLNYLLVALGCIYAVTGASLTRPIRVFAQSLHPLLGTLFSCPPCAGFWLGFGLWRAYPYVWMTPIEGALATCAVGALWSAIQSVAGMYDPPGPDSGA
jgi:hypothetical protein